MIFWDGKPNTYKEHNFIEIPPGDHRVQICKIVRRKFKNDKKRFDITYKVSGHHGKLWHNLWYIPEDMRQSEKRFFSFFKSFQIQDHDLDHFKDWVGKMGAVRVVHDGPSTDPRYNYEYASRVIFCLYGDQRDMLPVWRDGPAEVYANLFEQFD